MSTNQVAERDRDAERGFGQAYLEKLKSGDLGMLPVILGLVIIWTVFALKEDAFLSSFNLTNLALQISAIGITSIGVVWVLLLGEIDLAVGSISGLAAAFATVMNLDHGVAGWLSILLGLLVGALVGLVQGGIITLLRVPSFIVSLAGLIGWQGVLLYTLGSGGTRNITDEATVELNSTFYKGAVAWVLTLVVIGLFIASDVWRRVRRSRAGLGVEPLVAMIVRDAVVAAIGIIAVIKLTQDRGVPLALLIFLGLVVVMDLVARRTTFGRHVYAVGGNKEASRRAGIRVERIRLIVFVMSGVFAAAGGIMAASRLLAVNQASGGGTFLLTAIAAAVIGGVSLFGGRGSVYAALLGGLVLGSVANGIALLGLPSSSEYMITAAVLLAAVIVDATARRGRQASR